MNQIEKEEQRQLWIARMCEMEESGLTQEEWCRSKGIAYSTLRYWVRKFRREAEEANGTVNWLKVDLSAENGIGAICPANPASFSSVCIRILYGEFAVEIPGGCDPQQMLGVLQVLKAL
jgi:hypothetical protein